MVWMVSAGILFTRKVEGIMKRFVVAATAACLLLVTSVGCSDKPYTDPGDVDGVEVEGVPPLDGDTSGDEKMDK